jgi:hypothetical protein
MVGNSHSIKWVYKPVKDTAQVAGENAAACHTRHTYLNVKIRAENVRNDVVLQEPIGKTWPNAIRFTTTPISTRAYLPVQIDMVVDLRDTGQSHCKSGGGEIFEGQLKAVAVKWGWGLQGVFHGRPHVICARGEENFVERKKKSTASKIESSL